MIGAKPIEAGCLAILVNMPDGKFEGWEVKVGSYIGEHYPYKGSDYWKVTPIDHAMPLGIDGTCHEKYLLRIDDPEIQKQIESEMVQGWVRELAVS